VAHDAVVAAGMKMGYKRLRPALRMLRGIEPGRYVSSASDAWAKERDAVDRDATAGRGGRKSGRGGRAPSEQGKRSGRTRRRSGRTQPAASGTRSVPFRDAALQADLDEVFDDDDELLL
jgi:hypothetical protein